MFSGDLIQTIDQRIFALAPDISRSWGTVSYYSGDPNDRQAMVTFDGSSAAVPCRVPANITMYNDDRVTCERYGTIWVITHNFTPPPVPPAPPVYGVWLDYSSSMTFRGSTGGVTKGTSGYEAEYMEVNAKLTTVRVRIEMRSGFVQGTGVVLVGLPYVQSAASIRRAAGVWWLNDSGVRICVGTVMPFDDDEVQFFTNATAALSGGAVSFGGTPFDSADDFVFTYDFEPG